VDAIKLRLKEAGGKVAGHRVHLYISDEGGDLSTALGNARTLVQGDHVEIMIGPLNAAFMGGLMPFYVQHRIPVISLLNEATAVQRSAHGWLFTPQGSLESVSYPLGLYASQVLHLRTATTLGADFTGGHSIIGGFAAGFAHGGGRVVQEQWAPLGTTDFSQYLAQLANADLFVDWNAGSGDQALVEEYFGRRTLRQLAFGYGDALSEAEVTALGPRMIGAIAPMVYTWRLNNSANHAFVTAYRQVYHRAPIEEIDEGAYEAMTVALAALAATHGNTDSASIRTAILREKLNTPAGRVTFDRSTGFGIRQVYILKVERFGNQLGWQPIAAYMNTDPSTPPGD